MSTPFEQGARQVFHGTLSAFGPRPITLRYLARTWFGFVRVRRVEVNEYPFGHPKASVHTPPPNRNRTGTRTSQGVLTPPRFLLWLD